MKELLKKFDFLSFTFIYEVVIETIFMVLMWRTSAVVVDFILSVFGAKLGDFSLSFEALFTLIGYLVLFDFPMELIKRGWSRNPEFFEIIKGEPDSLSWFSSNYFDRNMHLCVLEGSNLGSLIDGYLSLYSLESGRIRYLFRYITFSLGFSIFIYLCSGVILFVGLSSWLFSLPFSSVNTLSYGLVCSYLTFIVLASRVRLLYSLTEDRFYLTFRFFGKRK